MSKIPIIIDDAVPEAATAIKLLGEGKWETETTLYKDGAMVSLSSWTGRPGRPRELQIRIRHSIARDLPNSGFHWEIEAFGNIAKMCTASGRQWTLADAIATTKVCSRSMMRVAERYPD